MVRSNSTASSGRACCQSMISNKYILIDKWVRVTKLCIGHPQSFFLPENDRVLCSLGDYYFISISDNGFDANGYVQPNSTYYRLDLYAPRCEGQWQEYMQLRLISNM